MMIVIALALAAAAQEAEPLNLHLICQGGGSQQKSDSVSAFSTDSTGASGTTTVTGSRQQQFEDQVRIDLQGVGGRIRIPQAMLPALRGGKDGWFELSDVRATADEITAKASINLLNKVRLRLDRITGTASFTVLKGQFTGRCSPYDPATTQRAF